MGGGGWDIHVTTQELDLERHHSFTEPDHGEDAAEDGILLIGSRSEAEKQAQEKTKYQGPPQVPVPQPRAHIALKKGFGVHDTTGEPGEFLSRAGYASAPDIGIGASKTALRVKHGATKQVPWVEHLS